MSNNDEIQFEESGDKKTQARQEERSEPRNEDTRRSSSRDDDRDDRDDRGRSRGRKEERRNWNMGSLGRAQNRPQMSGVSDAALSAMIETFKNAKSFDNPNIEADIQQARFQVLPYTGRTATRSLPTLLVCLPLPKLACTLVYSLVVEPFGPMATRSSVSRGDTFDALVLPEDRMNDNYTKGIRDEAAGLGQSRVILVGTQVILADTIADVGEKENSRVISQLFDNAIQALCGYRQNLIDNTNGNRASEYRLRPEALERGDRLECTIEYNAPFGIDTSGIPIRTDGLVTVHYSERSDEDEDDEMFNRIPMVEARVSLDLFIEDDGGERDRARLSRRSSRRRGRDERDEEVAFMQPVININSIASVDNYPYSMELVGLALGNIALLSNDYRWTNMVRPRKTIGGKLKPVSNLADLTLLADLDEDQRRAAADLVSPNMNDDDFGDFIDETCKPEVSFGMVVSGSSENSWVLSIFERIGTAKNPRDVEGLITRLYDSLDTLTGDRFRDVYKDLNKGSMPMPVESAGTRALIGTWTDPDTNTKRPASEWNVPAVLSRIGAKDLEAVRDFQLTFEDTRHTVEYNLSDRYHQLKKFVPDLRIVQTAEQLVFQKNFFAAIAQALDEARMSSYIASGDTLSGRRNVGNRLFSSSATSDAGTSRRTGRRDRDDRRDGRRIFGDSDGY